jgi:threonine dehydratase
MVTLDDVRKAQSAISGHVNRTPLIYSDSLSRMAGAEVHLKCENLQRTGSFKARGAFNKLLGLGARKVIAASMGNHAQGVAYAAAALGIRSRIVMPRGASMAKELAVRAYGGEVVFKGETLMEAMEHALSEKDFTFIHTFDDERLIAGQGTVALEVMEEAEKVDYVLVPVGGGSLISGIAVAVKALSPGTRVIGVQAEAATSALISFREGAIVEKTPGPTLADGIAVGRVGEGTLEIISKHVDDMFTVDEGSIAGAVLLFIERKRLVVEGAGAVPLAHLLNGKERYGGKRVVLIVSGGNIDVILMDRVINKGLAESGRIGNFALVLDDVPGALSRAAGVIAESRGNILSVAHDRLAGELPIGKTKVRFTVETRDAGHLDGMLSSLRKAGLETEGPA